MSSVQYIGETLWIYYLGHFLLILSFTAAGLAAYSYFKDLLQAKSSDPNGSWKGIGRVSFIIHGMAMLVVIAMVFYAMGQKMYEYYYVFQHVNSELPDRYIFSAFWEGQEGSFMLWMFWHIILGFVVMWKSKEWESSVLFVIALVNFLINLMLLGIHIEIGDFTSKIGINPIVLLRQSIDAPIFSNADYLSLIEGNGLNPLLQNYWNTIHPPVLFLGFASVIIPFGFALGGLITGKHKEWLAPAYKWCLFSAFIFGVGILMGSAWAYEALTFGGFWAWDPVENSSFVPWLTLVAGVHTHMVAKNTGYSIRATYFLYILSFLLVLYSTFLTRSGVLGDTSVHSFTEMGLETLLLIMVVAFAVLGLGTFLKKYKTVPEPQKEESVYSREFWMFIGSLVLLFSAILIIGATSLPVLNKVMEIFNPGYEGLVIQDPVQHYNKYQVWIAVFMSILSGIVIFLRYRSKVLGKRQRSVLLLAFGVSTVLAAVTYMLLTWWLDLYYFQYRLLAFLCLFVIFANLYYLTTVIRTSPRSASASLSHAGFGIMIIGVLASGLNQTYISTDPFGQSNTIPDDDLSNMVLLYEDFPLLMNGYRVKYEGDTLRERERFFDISFIKVDDNNRSLDSFRLTPSVLLSNDKTKVNAQIPSTKHYWSKDIFTDIVGLPPYKRDAEAAREVEDTLQYMKFIVAPGDTIGNGNWKVVLEDITFTPDNPNFDATESDLALGANLSFWRPGMDTSFHVQPVISLDNTMIITISELVNPLQLKVRVNDSVMNDLLLPSELLFYENITMKLGDTLSFRGHSIVLQGFNQTPQNRSYVREEGDIVIGAKMTIDDQYSAEPIFLIRDEMPFNFREFIPEAGLYIRFVNIDPGREEFTFMMAKDERLEKIKIPLEIAENVPRNDWIYLRARVFPGINFFWIGAILMLTGFIIAVFLRKDI